MNAAIEAAVLMHPFERAGLGKAPFRFVGSYKSLYQAIPGDPSCPVQPGSSCDYCGQGISLVCRIKDRDGREFKVGCDCVRRTGDKRLSERVDQAQLEHERLKRSAKAEQSKADLSALLAADETRIALAAHPHPNAYRAEQGDTLLDWADWMAKRAGAAGRKRALAAIEKAVSRG